MLEIRSPLVAIRSPFGIAPDVAAGGGGVAFSPEDFFAGTDTGIWLSARDSVLRQTSGGALAAANGDPVSQQDRTAGTVTGWTQGTSAYRPTLDTTGGVKSLSYDGVDDFSSMDVLTTTQFTMVASFASIALTPNSTPIRHAISGGNRRSWQVIVDGAGLKFSVSENGATSVIGAVSAAVGSGPVTVAARATLTLAEFWVNGVLVSSHPLTAGVYATPVTLEIGGRSNIGDWSAHKICEFGYVQAARTDAEIAAATAYALSATG